MKNKIDFSTVGYIGSVVFITACSGKTERPNLTRSIKLLRYLAPFEFEDANGNFVGIDMEPLAAIAEIRDLV